MSSLVIVDNDLLIFSPAFGSKTVTIPGVPKISGTGEASIQNKKICIAGDEKKVSVSATYISGAFSIPGTGTVTITSLAADQQATYATARTPVIVKGSEFTALFTVNSPALNPQSVPDPTPTASGTGTFINSQQFVTAEAG